MPTSSAPVVHISPGVSISNDSRFTLIGGVNVIEDRETTFRVAEAFVGICSELGIPFIFKASFDKANRSSINSFRGIGMQNALDILASVKSALSTPVLTDIHEPQQAAPVAEVADVIQIPAFLARQTDLLLAAGNTGKAINIKKPQFLSPSQMRYPVSKVSSTGNSRIMVCERGTQFGYDNLIVDMLGFQGTIDAIGGLPLIFDVTHSLQKREAGSPVSGGRREQVAPLARAALAVGIAGIFLEAHPDPDKAPCDGPSALPLDAIAPLVRQLFAIDELVKSLVRIEI